MGERIGAELEVYGHGLHALAAFLHPRCAVAARSPQSATLPARTWIVDTAIEALGVEASRIRHLDGDHLAVFEGNKAIIEVAGRNRDVIAKAERVVLVDPRIVA